MKNYRLAITSNDYQRLPENDKTSLLYIALTIGNGERYARAYAEASEKVVILNAAGDEAGISKIWKDFNEEFRDYYRVFSEDLFPGFQAKESARVEQWVSGLAELSISADIAALEKNRGETKQEQESLISIAKSILECMGIVGGDGDDKVMFSDQLGPDTVAAYNLETNKIYLSTKNITLSGNTTDSLLETLVSFLGHEAIHYLQHNDESYSIEEKEFLSTPTIPSRMGIHYLAHPRELHAYAIQNEFTRMIKSERIVSQWLGS